MLLKIDTEDCEKLNITPLEYLYLNLQHLKLSLELSKTHLMLKEYLNSDGTISIKGTALFTDTLDKDKTDYDWFVETYNLFPHKVDNRVLKSLSLNTGDGQHCLNKYKIYVKKDPNTGLKMYTGLKIQLSIMNKGNDGLKFMQDIKTWFNQRTWERFCDLELEPEKPTERVKRI